jgi:hypothetical protein
MAAKQKRPSGAFSRVGGGRQQNVECYLLFFPFAGKHRRYRVLILFVRTGRLSPESSRTALQAACNRTTGNIFYILFPADFIAALSGGKPGG